jgi:hypothetical protein
MIRVKTKFRGAGWEGKGKRRMEERETESVALLE